MSDQNIFSGFLVNIKIYRISNFQRKKVCIIWPLKGMQVLNYNILGRGANKDFVRGKKNEYLEAQGGGVAVRLCPRPHT